MTPPLTPGDWELLSAYLDGQLTAAEQARMQDLLARRAELRQGFEELRRTRAVLRAAPRRRAPRNFTLTPAMARQARPAFRWGWAPSLRLASALATFLFTLSFFFRLSPAGFPAMAPMAAPAPLAAQSERVLQEKSQADSAAAPPIIIWNDTGRGGGPAGAGGGFYGGGPTTVPAGNSFQATAETATADLNPPAVAAAATTPTPVAKSMAAPAPQATVSSLQNQGVTTSATGPILGVAPAAERGQAVPDAYTGAVQAAPAVSAMPPASSAPAQSASVWFWVQAGLAGIAVVCGLAAFILWWRSRH